MIQIKNLDWEKSEGLLPAIIQDADDNNILMLGYMNQESLQKTQETGQVTFFSRSKNRLWVKGETSGNILHFVSLKIDCDYDTLLIQARPSGPVCHTGAETCFGDKFDIPVLFLNKLSKVIENRKIQNSTESYVAKLFKEGSKRIAQKVGEEGVELSIAHLTGEKEEILNEAADLIFHTLILLQDAELNISDVCNTLLSRNR